MNKLKIGLGVAVIIIVVLATTNSWFYMTQQNKINSLNDDKSGLLDQISQLQTENTSLQGVINTLTNDKNNLVSQVSHSDSSESTSSRQDWPSEFDIFSKRSNLILECSSIVFECPNCKSSRQNRYSFYIVNNI